MNTLAKQVLPAHMNTEQYHSFLDSCFDEECGYHNDAAMDSLQEMIDLSLAIEKMSEEIEDLKYTDVALDIDCWEDEFVCESGDLVFRSSKKEGFFIAVLHTHLHEVPLGMMNVSGIFVLLTAQRRLEQGR